MSSVQNIEVASAEDGMRLDRWFRTHFPNVTHGALQKMMRKGQVRLDGGRVKANARISAGQVIRVPPLDDKPAASREKNRTFSEQDAELLRACVIHRDDDVIVLNKPAGLATQGGTGTDRHVDGMLDALRFGAPERPRLVHRLDRDTSGVLLLARTRAAATALGEGFRGRDTEKTYWALVAGVPRPDRGHINLPLAKRGRAGDQRMVAAQHGDRDAQKAETIYATVDHAGRRFSWLALSPLTGRTHQLRVHMAAIGHPVIGDFKYGGSDADPGDGLDPLLHLHARTLRMAHPRGGMLEVTAGLSEHMRRTWDALGFSDVDGREDHLFAEEGWRP